MKVEVAVLADYANVAEGGKLNVMGIFDRISAPAFPAQHAFMVLAFRLRMEFEDRDSTNRTEIVLVDEDGKALGGGTGEVRVGSIPPGQRSTVTQIIQFPGLRFEHPGEYRFRLMWNGVESCTIPLTLQQSLSPPST